ncbi:anti-repressor SinI family protein [Virgibacillus litoralis]|uniref:DNA-binding transcriptional MerR regulator n=1 Tax=Virgibacillus litoralis TaxID=578221 RepID=A0ABS4HHY0_9BACI|nr:anti-repressor SinI family protein [Virgibacillus litoralis]MBP1950531.1 DNA-binding transcriptional MerR regulator [Virgibacillus litoralis]
MNDQFMIALDEEWVELVQEAKAAGLSIEEIKDFLQNGHEDS